MDTGIKEVFDMKTIEERAHKYMQKRLKDYETFFGEDLREVFIKGAESEHEELTRWNDPKIELPEDDRKVLLKLRINYSTDIRYAVGYFHHDKHQWIGFPLGYDEIIGWREIHL